ncbi:MAG TPA: phosphatidate cytidylyltransferase [Candidatus Dormibacteraeota bacterium]|jgi:phosphatidate cytidylyltransferase|nr:phosphatidate cytidylyltransferase [Candidatus Dormibacteraeota bacterium]
MTALRIRVLSGLAVGIGVLVLALSGAYGVYGLVVIIVGLSLWEFRGLTVHIGSPAPFWLLFPLGAYFAFGGTAWGQGVDLVLALALIPGLSIFLIARDPRDGFGRWAMGLAGAVYIGVPFSFYLRIYHSGPGKVGLVLTLLTLLSVAATDVAALVVGSRFGRRPFFARISPNKTLEGALAGVVGAALIFGLGGSLWLNFPAVICAVLGVLVGMTAEVGDLVESQMKRAAGVKDSSNLIPGHGGVLDRVDSALFPPIIVFVYAAAWHLI